MSSSRVTLTILFDKPLGGELAHKLFQELRTLGATRHASVGGSKWKLIFENPTTGKCKLAELTRQTANKYGIMLK